MTLNTEKTKTQLNTVFSSETIETHRQLTCAEDGPGIDVEVGMQETQ